MSDYYHYRDRSAEELDGLLARRAGDVSKNGKAIVAGSIGGGATSTVSGNYLTDVNITININFGAGSDGQMSKVDPEAIKAVHEILDHVGALKGGGAYIPTRREQEEREPQAAPEDEEARKYQEAADAMRKRRRWF
jgi:hypothetical protein